MGGPQNSQRVSDSGEAPAKAPPPRAIREDEQVEAYRIDRFGRVDGIVL
jgi:hypothetical protein